MALSADSNNLATAAKQLEHGLDIKENVYKGKTYKHCFSGTECVKVILDLKLANNEAEAVNFGIDLMRNGIIKHVEGLHAFKNQDLLYCFVQMHERKKSGYAGTQSGMGRAHTMRNPSMHQYKNSGNARDLYKGGSMRVSKRASMHSMGGGLSMMIGHTQTFSSVGDLMQRAQQDFLNRKTVYFRVNRYMRLNRLKEANNFLRELLKYVANKSTLDWAVVQGPTRDGSDINKVTSLDKEKWLQDVMGESQACWIDVNLLECKLKLFYEGQGAAGGDGTNIREVIGKLQSILSALGKSVERDRSLETQSYYYLFVACEVRACLAYAIVKSSSIGYAAYAGLALGHCREAMKLNPFHSLSAAVYGYLLDRCLDKYEEARMYLEYAIHLNNYYDSVNAPKNDEEDGSAGGSGPSPSSSVNTPVSPSSRASYSDFGSQSRRKPQKDFSYHRFAYIHVWLATLLVNFEDEFREIEYAAEQRLRAKFKRDFEKKHGKKLRGGTVDVDSGDDTEDLVTSDDADSGDEEHSGTRKPGQLNSGDVGASSITLVRQMTEANAFHRQRDSIIGSAIHGAGTSLQYGYSHTAETPNVHHGIHEPEDESKSVTITASDVQNEQPPVGPTMTVQIDTEIAEKLAEEMADNAMTNKVGTRFGSDFQSQMQTIPNRPDGHFSLALQLEPQNSRFHSIYGVFLIHQEKLDDAKPHFEKAIKYDPKDVVSLNNLGWILSLQRFSQFQEAKAYLTKASSLRPKSAAIHFNLARLLAHAFGKQEQKSARKHYAAALMYDKENPHILYFYSCFQCFMLKDRDSATRTKKQSDKYLSSRGVNNKESTFEVNGYIEHARILQREERFNAAKFLLKRAAQLDASKKREIKELLREIQQEEKDMMQMRKHHSMRQ